jgi:hypothetical protein
MYRDATVQPSPPTASGGLLVYLSEPETTAVMKTAVFGVEEKDPTLVVRIELGPTPVGADGVLPRDPIVAPDAPSWIVIASGALDFSSARVLRAYTPDSASSPIDEPLLQIHPLPPNHLRLTFSDFLGVKGNTLRRTGDDVRDERSNKPPNYDMLVGYAPDHASYVSGQFLDSPEYEGGQRAAEFIVRGFRGPLAVQAGGRQVGVLPSIGRARTTLPGTKAPTIAIEGNEKQWFPPKLLTLEVSASRPRDLEDFGERVAALGELPPSRRLELAYPPPDPPGYLRWSSQNSIDARWETVNVEQNARSGNLLLIVGLLFGIGGSSALLALDKAFTWPRQ